MAIIMLCMEWVLSTSIHGIEWVSLCYAWNRMGVIVLCMEWNECHCVVHGME